MAPVLLFLATHVALALNSNRYNVSENSTKLRHVNYFQKEIYQAVIPTYSNKGAINSNTNNYETLYNASTPTTFKNNDDALTTKANDNVNFETTQSSNSNINLNDSIKRKFQSKLNTVNFSMYYSTQVYAQNASQKETKNVFLENESNQNSTIVDFDRIFQNGMSSSSEDNNNLVENSKKIPLLEYSTVAPVKIMTKLNQTIFFTFFNKTKVETTSDIPVTSRKLNTYQTNRFKKALSSSLFETPVTINKENGFSKPNTSTHFNTQVEINSNRLSTTNPVQLSRPEDVYQSSSNKVTTNPANLDLTSQRITTKEFTTVHNIESKNGRQLLTTSMPHFNIQNQNFQKRFKTIENGSIVRALGEFTTQSSQFSDDVLSKTTLNLNFSNTFSKAVHKKIDNGILTTENIYNLNCSKCFNISTSSTLNKFEKSFEPGNDRVTPSTFNDHEGWNTNDSQDLAYASTLSSQMTTDEMLDKYKNLLMTTSATTVNELFETTEFVNNDTLVENPSNVSVKVTSEFPWPVKKEAVVEGDLVLGGLMMVHEREDSVTCGPIMPQGGIQALEAMLYTLDRLNEASPSLLPNITLGAHILDDCDKDTYGLEMAVDFIKGRIFFIIKCTLSQATLQEISKPI